MAGFPKGVENGHCLVNRSKSPAVFLASGEVSLAVLSDRDGAVRCLLIAHHEHVRDLVQLVLADLLPDRLRALVDIGPETRLAQGPGHLARVRKRRRSCRCPVDKFG